MNQNVLEPLLIYKKRYKKRIQKRKSRRHALSNIRLHRLNITYHDSSTMAPCTSKNSIESGSSSLQVQPNSKYDTNTFVFDANQGNQSHEINNDT